MRTPLLTLAVTCASLLAPLTLNTHAQIAPVAAAASAANARVIVKFKADSSLMRMQALSATGQHTERAQALGQRMGMTLRAGAGVAERTQVVFANGMSSEQLAQRLAAESDVEYAVPDQRRHLLAAPIDSFYTTRPLVGTTSGGPVSGQWYLRPNLGEVKASIDVEPAWNITTGSSSIVVAVLDTGVRFDHPDLLGGNFLPGYDMIGPDTMGGSTFAIANDRDGRDANAEDPGDWITLAETTQVGGQFEGCSVDSAGQPVKEDSSWHGTQTSGLIGALTNNGTGIASVGRNVRVLPVRVLGKCGGFDGDIVAGMLWAAGVAVPGLPTNPNPARVLNLSLGGGSICTKVYLDAMPQITAKGAVVVASAGNSSGHAVSSPANCPGVIAVSGLRHVGTKVGFSDLGPEISISAPGGNCVNQVGACLFPIITTANSGTTTPVAGAAGAIYTDAFKPSLGTSFSAPLVAGTAALMLSANPALTPTQLRTMMQSTARAFPAVAGVAQCAAPSASVPQDECNCTTTTCGAGMLDAGAAVTAAAAAATVQAHIAVTPAAPQATAPVTLSAATSTVPTGRTISAYAWTLTNSGGIITGSLAIGTGGVTASATPTAAGTFTVGLTVTDSTGAQSTVASTVTVAAAPGVISPPPPAGSAPQTADSGGGGGGALGGGWLLLLSVAVLALRGAPSRYRRS